MKLFWRRIKCLFRHDYQHHQEIFVTHTNWEDNHDVVIAFKICRRCAASRLIHILK